MKIKVMLDSGAHSLFNLYARDSGDFSFYETDEFWQYVDAYAEFVKKWQDKIDVYVNVDVIKNPELSWKSQKYLEDTHGLRPLPVVHHGTDLKWLRRYMDDYEYIGIGGVAAGAKRQDFFGFANDVFDIICDSEGMPRWKLHGFAMTAMDSIVKYPWWSVDSTAWVKTSRMGTLYIPYPKGGSYDYTRVALRVTVSSESPSIHKLAQQNKDKHILTLRKDAQRLVVEYLHSIGLTLVDVAFDYTKRDVANAIYFKNLCDQLPEWPWPFKRKRLTKRMEL